MATVGNGLFNGSLSFKSYHLEAFNEVNILLHLPPTHTKIIIELLSIDFTFIYFTSVKLH